MKTKKILKYLLVAATVGTIFTACKKDNKTVSRTTAQKVIGKWSISSLVGVTYNAGVGYPYTVPTSSADYIDFRTDGKSYSFSINQHDTTTYHIINEHTIQLDLDTAQIKTLTDNSFVLFAKKNEGQDSMTYTITLKK